ncbi:N-acetyl-1-D-myo-inositol-2-amino-2-deoxy-alpha-D-glucopyranoside deacetylase [Saccharopolyspora aridisoli]|uniref:N-acetyl-1-D-myo-inositol-2-amino-2-deoxy-alpha-D-glucopyranoside deacetylase n=1 Tax=Saccharopolyspora aridisoli TaxID=2530385 RepID=A0A4R4UD48_9PSEU|nr:N-acetyl-1-D-myo-inositol-2-amino-2-deoxy-alpha-D-glucopyranoside deacetylase [Saccharopolyspora aridisoli]TDC89441.1 N-acetyl-1-D-myo-inositol-2-amino-2-deoxy-alpha-D-glucopyranoside deacetylase [Saccharopolyspora aridisoli]
MLVHAHPDDEATGTGATMARYSAEGATVSLVTCTSGELGEVIADDLAHLRDNPQALGEYRRGEIERALVELGDIRQHWLGGPGRFHDSGMAGEESNNAAGAFATADPAEVTRAMVAVLRAERPQVAVTYDQNGGYGHPDHIAAHKALMGALGPAADADYDPELGEAWDVPKVYWTAMPRSLLTRAVEEGLLSEDVVAAFEPSTVPDEDLTTQIDGREFHANKLAALRTYRSQVNIDDDGFFAKMVNDPEFGREHFLLVRGERGPGEGPFGWETDLFSGLD